LKTEIVGVKGYVLTCRPMLGMDALDIMPTVLAIAAPLLSQGSDLSVTLSGVAKMLAAPEHKGALRELVTAFIACTVVKSPTGQTTEMDEATFNAIFSGSYAEMLKWASVHIKVNFADFFPTSGETEKSPAA
jgi:hypothetical protein